MLICQSLLSSIPLKNAFIPLIFQCCLKFIYFILFNPGIVQHCSSLKQTCIHKWKPEVFSSQWQTVPGTAGPLSANSPFAVYKEAWNKSNGAEVKPKHLRLPLVASCRIGPPKLFPSMLSKRYLGQKNTHSKPKITFILRDAFPDFAKTWSASYIQNILNISFGFYQSDHFFILWLQITPRAKRQWSHPGYSGFIFTQQEKVKKHLPFVFIPTWHMVICIHISLSNLSGNQLLFKSLKRMKSPHPFLALV